MNLLRGQLTGMVGMLRGHAAVGHLSQGSLGLRLAAEGPHQGDDVADQRPAQQQVQRDDAAWIYYLASYGHDGGQKVEREAKNEEHHHNEANASHGRAGRSIVAGCGRVLRSAHSWSKAGFSQAGEAIACFVWGRPVAVVTPQGVEGDRALAAREVDGVVAIVKDPVAHWVAAVRGTDEAPSRLAAGDNGLLHVVLISVQGQSAGNSQQKNDQLTHGQQRSTHDKNCAPNLSVQAAFHLCGVGSIRSQEPPKKRAESVPLFNHNRSFKGSLHYKSSAAITCLERLYLRCSPFYIFALDNVDSGFIEGAAIEGDFLCLPGKDVAHISDTEGRSGDREPIFRFRVVGRKDVRGPISGVEACASSDVSEREISGRVVSDVANYSVFAYPVVRIYFRPASYIGQIAQTLGVHHVSPEAEETNDCDYCLNAYPSNLRQREKCPFRHHVHSVSTYSAKSSLTYSCVKRILLLKGLAAHAVDPSAFPRTQRVAPFPIEKSAHAGAEVPSREAGGLVGVLTDTCSSLLSLRPPPSSRGVIGRISVRSTAMATEPVRGSASTLSLSITLPEPVPGDVFTYIASGANAAIAIAAAMESAEVDDLTELMSACASSPEFQLLKQCYRRDLATIAAGLPDAALREEFVLDLVLCRMFCAGVRYAKLPREVRRAA